MWNSNRHYHLHNVKNIWVNLLKWKPGKVLQPYTWCIFYLNHQNSIGPHQMVLAGCDLFTNTFTKRKAEQGSYPHRFKSKTHLLAESVFLPTVGGEGSLWKKLFIHQYLSINSGNPAKEEKPTTLDTGWITGKTEKCFKEGNNTMHCFVLVCDVHSFWTAGGAGRNTGFRVQSCCLWKTETHAVKKKDALRQCIICMSGVFQTCCYLRGDNFTELQSVTSIVYTLFCYSSFHKNFYISFSLTLITLPLKAYWDLPA